MGHGYMGHNYMGHNYMCHNYTGHNYRRFRDRTLPQELHTRGRADISPHVHGSVTEMCYRNGYVIAEMCYHNGLCRNQNVLAIQ